MSSHATPADIRKEVRFSVVMYGGVSLAIYINGIAQELLRLVRSTATKNDTETLIDEEDLRGSEVVYRQLGRMLGRQDIDSWDPDDPPRTPLGTRFVIDILSGTSAGGINAVYLAKALANNQNIDDLQTLWINEAEIADLLNDKRSVKNTGLDQQKPPPSLLNSQRMYTRLVQAFDDMEEEEDVSNDRPRSDYLEDLDLFVTTTDLQGLPIPLRLADGVVWERRHRNFFHFRYSSGQSGPARNDFKAENNAFLAFAARCTSAFPFAFQPMRLRDIDEVLRLHNKPWHRGLSGSDAGHWKGFFPYYRRVSPGGQSSEDEYREFTIRSFADGGYLDNKPFGHAIDALENRHAPVAVDRKLIYIEPSPETIYVDEETEKPPDAVENTLAALTLSSYETIRQDLQRVLQRNRVIDRVSTLIAGLDEDVAQGDFGDYRSSKEYPELYLDKMIKQNGMGVSYGGYHRLKVAKVSDEMALMVTRAAGFRERSDEFQAVRLLVGAWRSRHYARYQKQADGRASENRFLMQYDLTYRMRRLRFVLARMDQLSHLGEEARRLVENKPDTQLPGERGAAPFREALADLRKKLRVALLKLNRKRESLTRGDADNPLASKVAKLVSELHKAEVGPEGSGSGVEGVLHHILEGGSRKDCRDRAAQVYQAIAKPIDDLADHLSETLKEISIEVSDECKEALKTPEGASGEKRRAWRAANDFYRNFERYDLIMFPVLETADVGHEIDPVEVLRISPRDARSIVDERKTGKPKLAGAALMHFGAFLDRGWRQSDILWGRLDGAERIIQALVPGQASRELRKKLIRKAHREILAEHFRIGVDRAAAAVGEELTGRRAAPAPDQELRDSLREKMRDTANPVEEDPSLGGAVAEAARLHSERERYKDILYRAFRQRYSAGPDPAGQKLEARKSASLLARGTRITGKILEKVSDDYGVNDKPAATLARLGTVLWGLIEVAVPNSLANLFFRHWLKLLYFFEVLLIAGSLLLDKQGAVFNFGLSALAITLAAHLAVASLGSWMSGRRLVFKAIIAILAAAVLALAGYGGYQLYDRYWPEAADGRRVDAAPGATHGGVSEPAPKTLFETDG